MIITIKDKEYNVRFGVAFLRELDKKYETKGIGGISFGVGIEVCVPKIVNGDVLALYEVVKTGIEGAKPTDKALDEFFDSCDIDALTEEVLDELKNSNATRKKTEAAMEEINQTAKKRS